MKEATLRKWHRTSGIIIAVFIIVQVVSGIVLSIENILGDYWSGVIHDIHEGFGKAGGIYRILLGVGLVWMVISGSIIFMKIRERMKNR